MNKSKPIGWFSRRHRTGAAHMFAQRHWEDRQARKRIRAHAVSPPMFKGLAEMVAEANLVRGA